MNEQQVRALDLGLKEFDRVVARRRRVRRGAGVAVFVLIAGTAAFFLLRTQITIEPKPGIVAIAHRQLPAYVEVITDDTRLALELEVANACERVGRKGDRVYIVECTATHEPGIDPLTQQ